MELRSQADHSGADQSAIQLQLDSLHLEDAELVLSLQQQYGSRSLPCILSIFHALCSLDPYALAALAALDPSQLNPTTRSRLYGGADNNLGSILQQMAEVLNSRQEYAVNTNNRNSVARRSEGTGFFAHDAIAAVEHSDGFHSVKRRRFDHASGEPSGSGPMRQQWMGDSGRGVFS
jgi:hypothetical protein